MTDRNNQPSQNDSQSNQSQNNQSSGGSNSSNQAVGWDHWAAYKDPKPNGR
jgi:hypothetical protein